MDNNKVIQSYQKQVELVDSSIDKISNILSSAQSLSQQLPTLVNSFTQLKSEQLKLDAQLKALQETLQNNLEKFKEIVRGAEKRLDRQLDTIDRWTEMLLMRDLGTLDINEMNAQQAILEAIQMANDRFNNELDKLYSL